MVTGGVTEEVIRNLSKAEETEVWAQARVPVSRAAATKYRKPGDIKTAGVYRLPVLEATSPKPRCWQGRALQGRILSSSLFHRPSLVFLGFQLHHCGLCL